MSRLSPQIRQFIGVGASCQMNKTILPFRSNYKTVRKVINFKGDFRFTRFESDFSTLSSDTQLDVTLQELPNDPRVYRLGTSKSLFFHPNFQIRTPKRPFETWIDVYDQKKVSLKTTVKYDNFDPRTLDKFFNFRYLFNNLIS